MWDHRKLPLLGHFTSTFLKTYLPQFLLPSASRLPFRKRLQGIRKSEKKGFKTLNKHQNSDSDMTRMLKLSDQEFFKTMTNMLKALMKKVDNMQEQMDNVSRKMEILRKNQKINARD